MRTLLIATAALLAATSISSAQASKPEQSTTTKKLGDLEYRTEQTKTKNGETRQYQLDVDKKNDVFLYGQATKIDPGYRQPIPAGKPNSATGEPETRYGIGFGLRF
ncbi:MAG: hypothetical protein ACRECC_06880 [Pseudolabrys sp.]|jgi:hypothetical protein